MNGLNKVFLIGTLGADPKSSTTREGKNYVTLSLATNRTWKNVEGDKQKKTDWHRVSVFGKRGELCQEYLKKGQNVCVEGYITNYTVGEEGNKRWFTTITAEAIEFLPSNPKPQEAPRTESRVEF